MDSEDDTRDGLDELSRLFDPPTAPLPAQPVSPVPPAEAGPPAAVPPAFGSAPASGAAPASPPMPAAPLPPAFGHAVPNPAAAPASAAPGSAPAPVGRPPFSPPPLVPIGSPPAELGRSDAPPSSIARPPLVTAPDAVPPPVSAPRFATQPPAPFPPVEALGVAPTPAVPAPVAPTPDVPVSVRSEPDAPESATPAPAFGGAPIAPPREAFAARAAAPPTTPAAPSPVATLATPLSAPADAGSPDGGVAAPVALHVEQPPAAASPPVDPSGPLLPGPYEEVDEEELARSTLLERVMFVLAFIVPPVGLVGSLVAAARSSSNRGWVIGLVKAGIAVGIVFSLVAAGFGYIGYQALKKQQAHAQVAAASAAFCAAVAKDPSLVSPDGGWPQPAASVPQSLATMQEFVARWSALAKVSPGGIRPQVLTVASAGSEVIKTVTAQRTVDDVQNRALVQSAVTSSGVAGWRAEYCG